MAPQPAISGPLTHLYLLHPPIYLATALESCWRCHQKTPVYALFASHISGDDELLELREPADLLHFTYLQVIDTTLYLALQQRAPTYLLTASAQFQGRYYMNHCDRCQAPIGDSFLHNPSDAFAPDNMDSARAVRLTTLPLHQPVQIRATAQVDPDLNITQHASRDVA